MAIFYLNDTAKAVEPKQFRVLYVARGNVDSARTFYVQTGII
jgi:hypothetical protein